MSYIVPKMQSVEAEIKAPGDYDKIRQMSTEEIEAEIERIRRCRKKRL